MSPEFLCIYAQATVEEAVERVGRSGIPADALAWVYAMNTHYRLRGGLRLADLLRADPEARLAEVLEPVQTVRPDAPLEEVARVMTDFDLTVVAVVDEKEQLMGVVTVDDVLEVVLPQNWRRHFGLLGDNRRFYPFQRWVPRPIALPGGREDAESSTSRGGNNS